MTETAAAYVGQLQGWAVAAIVVFSFLLLVLLLLVFKYLNLWIRCLTTDAKIGLFHLIAMELRRVKPAVIVQARIMAVQAGLDVDTRLLEAQYLAGGNVVSVVRALIAADRAGIPLNFKKAAAIDLAGRDIFDAVSATVTPRVIDCPDPKRGTQLLDAVARDGIRMLVKARVTVRSNIERLVRGATEETIIARVGEGIVSAVGSSESYKDVLKNPDLISKAVLAKGLDAQTAYEIVSIDIADVTVAGVGDVGNVGALLETDRAEADKKIRQAEAEGLRAMAVAEQEKMKARFEEMRALTQENRAKVVLAEAQIPQAIADAFRSGNLGIMDYYRLRNIQADTAMRDSISGGGTSTEAGEAPHTRK
jgi:uncharacterized protein YqfA (UPF0365 family)